MNPQLLFWVPAALRMSILLLGAVILSFFFGAAIGLGAGLIGVCLMVVVQLHYLYRLSGWLDNPDSEKLPDGWIVPQALCVTRARMSEQFATQHS